MPKINKMVYKRDSKYVVGKINEVYGSVYVQAKFKSKGIWGKVEEGQSAFSTINNQNYNTKFRKALWIAFQKHLKNMGHSSNTSKDDYKVYKTKVIYESTERISITKINVKDRSLKRISKKHQIPLYILKRAKINVSKEVKFIEVKKKRKVVKRYRDRTKQPKNVKFKKKKNSNVDKDIYVSSKEYTKQFATVGVSKNS